MPDELALRHSLSVSQTLANIILIVPPLRFAIVVSCDLLKHVRREWVFDDHFSGQASILICVSLNRQLSRLGDQLPGGRWGNA